MRMEDTALCQKIEAGLREARIAHGDPKGRVNPVLWRISPRYFLISADWWRKIKTIADAFTRFYIRRTRRQSEFNDPFYFRLDCTIAANNVPMVVEWNLVPVGEAGVEVNRRLYTKLVSIPPGYHNPFPGNIAILADALRWYGGRVAILIPYSRRHYTRDYIKTAEMLRERGIDIEVVEPARLTFKNGSLSDYKGKVDVIYRIFQKVKDFRNDSMISNAIRSKAVRIFPPFSSLESKESMAWVFREYLEKYKYNWNRDKLKKSELKVLFQSLPWTWVTDPDCLPEILIKTDFLPVALRTWAEFFSEEIWREGFLLKPCEAFGSRNLVFSKDVTINEWRRSVLKSLIGWTKGTEKTLIQKMVELKRFPVIYLEGNKIVGTEPEWGTRLCVTGIWLPKKGIEIGDIDVALRPGRLVHQQADCVFVPALIEKT